MSQSPLRVRGETAWYILWSALLTIAAGDTLAPYPIFSANAGFLFSMLLAAMAAMQLMYGARFLDGKDRRVAAVLLPVFAVERLREWVLTLVPPSLFRGFDFSAYYLAAKVVSARPARSLYDLPYYPDGRMDLLAAAPLRSAWQAAALHYKVPFSAPFIYPPFFAVLMTPLAHLSYGSAYIAWQILTVIFLSGAVLFSLSAAGVRIHRKLALMLSVGVFSYFPACDGLYMGQIGGLIFLLLAAGVWLLTRKQTALSALAFAAATLIKLTPVLAVPALVFHRRWKWLAAYAAWVGGLMVVSISQAGWEAHKQFWREVLPSISCGVPVRQNLSVMAYVQELFLGRVPSWPRVPIAIPMYACSVSRLVALAIYCLMLVRLYWKRRDGDLAGDLALMMLLGLAVSPISWSHHYIIAVLPFLYLWYGKRESKDRTLMALFLAVGTNLAGYGLLLSDNPIIQLVLASVVPGLTVALIYNRLAPARAAMTGVSIFGADLGIVASVAPRSN